jgi:aspartate/methionine/tyrosine aminotransferase
MNISPFRLERYFAQYEFTAPCLLCCSDCESWRIDELLRLEPNAYHDLCNLRLGYTESLGSPELRTQIAALYDEVADQEILVHAGAEEAIFNFMQVTLNFGDQVIVHTPYYQSLGEIAKSLGAEVTEWRGAPRRAWELDLQWLKDVVTEKTKVVIVNFPHNPTGFLPSAAFVSELSALSEKYGFLVFSDEVYRGLEYNPARQLPAFADVNARGVSLGVMSKTYGLAGLRIGWIATRNSELFQSLSSFKDYTTICNSAPSEFLATLALRHRDAIVKRNIGIIRENLQLLETFFQRYSHVFEWYSPTAGPITFPRYRGDSVDYFCHQLVQKAGVLLLPGTLYGEEFDCVRIGFGRKNMRGCLERLSRFLDETWK